MEEQLLMGSGHYPEFWDTSRTSHGLLGHRRSADLTGFALVGTVLPSEFGSAERVAGTLPGTEGTLDGMFAGS